MTGTCHVKFTNLLTHLIYTIMWHAMFCIGVTGWWLQPYPLEVECCSSTAVPRVCRWSGLVDVAPELSWALLGLDCGSTALYTVLTISMDPIVTTHAIESLNCRGVTNRFYNSQHFICNGISRIFRGRALRPKRKMETCDRFCQVMYPRDNWFSFWVRITLWDWWGTPVSSLEELFFISCNVSEIWLKWYHGHPIRFLAREHRLQLRP